MSEWKTYKLGKDVVTKLGDGLHGTPIYNDNGEYYFINGSNLVDGKIVINTNTKKVAEVEFSKYKKDLSNKTILLGINGTIGNVALYNNEMCILGKSAAYLNINDDFDKNYVRYVLTNDHFQNYIKKNASGTTIKNVGLGLLREYEFSAPKDKAEQQQIAQILTSLDDKIELNLQMNQTLEKMAQALFKEWFVNLNFPNFDGVLENGLPKGWRMGELGDIIEFKNGKTTPSRDVNAIYPVYGANGIIGFADKFNAEKDVTVIGRVGSFCGSTYYSQKRSWVTDNAIIAKSSVSSSCFTFIKLESLNLNSYRAGSGQPLINQSILSSIDLVIPNKKCLAFFEEIATPIFEKINFNTEEIQTLTQTRDTLLPKLMSGKIELKN